MDEPHRKRPLHNFDLPELRWANQKLLRCRNLPSAPSSEHGIDAVRERLMLDLRAAAHTIKLSINDNASGNASGGAGVAAVRPWNLRTRRAACRAPAVEEKKVEKAVEKAVRFAVGLSRTEIEEDFRAMAGARPPRRPKKRPRTVQKELDQLFPGLWLTEITPETYKVEEVAE